MNNVAKPEKHEFKAEMKQLLHLIVHSLYTHPEVFLRELISNASDAMNKVRLAQASGETVRDADAKLEIRIEADAKSGRFSIEDTGIGMNQEELIRHLGTIAKSGTLDFLKKLNEEGKDRSDLIGQFGVGFYSVFMVTKSVEVNTLSAASDSQACKWLSDGESTFEIETSDRTARGTKIEFVLNEDKREFADEHKLKEIIRNYSNFADFPILMNGEQINKVEAIWRKKPSDIKEEEYNEFYKFISNDFEEPLRRIHLDVEGAAVSFKALLFIPKKAPFDIFRTFQDKGPDLYSNRVLIRHDFKDLLPEYLRFVRGVVDTSELPLNVSRELTQSSPVTIKIKDILTKRILSSLQDWASKESEAYDGFFAEFGTMLKSGIETDSAAKDKIVDLLRFETNKSEGKRNQSLAAYYLGLQAEQGGIYYLSGDSAEAIRNNPKLEYYKKNNLEVLLLQDPSDLFCVSALREYKEKKFMSIDEAGAELQSKDKIERPENEMDKELLKQFKEVLKEDAADVRISKRLVDSAATLVRPEGGLDAATEKMMGMMGHALPETKKILEINIEHPLLRNLARSTLVESSKANLSKYIRLIYDSAKLSEGSLSPTESQACAKRLQSLLQDISA
ncbi:MAG: molecular chaperone HtpG [Candidatus Omnitrophica bacterium]|nr:molecular chaperone HtpG [Candidatus Omnitrophota bacterium]